MTEWPRQDAILRSLLLETQGPAIRALEEEHARQLIDTAELRAHLDAMEAELVDDYVAGRLAPALQARFESSFLSDPERARSVEFARHLRHELSGPATRSTRVQPRQHPRRRVAAAVVALVALTAASTWWVWSAGRAESRARVPAVVEARGEQASPPRTVTVEPSPARVPAPRVEPRPRGVTPDLPTFALAPGGSRAPETGQAVIVPAGADAIRLELQWPAASGVRYRTAIVTPDGDEIWRSTDVTVQQRGESPALGVTLDARAVPPGDYVLRLAARAPAGAWRTVADFPFRLTHRNR